MDTMQHLQKSQAAFIVFTLIQIYFFIFDPSMYDHMTHGFEGPPFYAMYRLIGSKEIGLMSIYFAGVLANDWDVAGMTVIGRLSTLVMFPYMVFFENAPWVLLLGIIQDVIGALASGYFILTEKRKPTKYMVTLRPTHSVLPRFMIAMAGVFEVYFGIEIFRNPFARKFADSPLFGAPKHINIQLFGYMSLLVGLYQLRIALLKEADVLAFLAVAFHHLNFYLTTKVVVSAAAGEPFYPPNEHLYCGWVVLITTLLALLLDRLAVLDDQKKRQ